MDLSPFLGPPLRTRNEKRGRPASLDGELAHPPDRHVLRPDFGQELDCDAGPDDSESDDSTMTCAVSYTHLTLPTN